MSPRVISTVFSRKALYNPDHQALITFETLRTIDIAAADLCCWDALGTIRHIYEVDTLHAEAIASPMASATLKTRHVLRLRRPSDVLPRDVRDVELRSAAVCLAHVTVALIHHDRRFVTGFGDGDVLVGDVSCDWEIFWSA